MQLAAHSFEFPTLSFANACRVISALEMGAVDVGALKGYAHFDPDEIEANTRGTIESIRSATSSTGLVVSDFFPSFGSGFGARPVNDPDPEVRSANLRRFKAFVEVAGEIGSPGITLLPGVLNPQLGLEGSLELAAVTFQEYLPLAQQAGLRLSFEGHIGSVVDTPELVMELVRRVPGLTVTLDYSHFVAQRVAVEKVHSLIKKTGHVHLRQARPGRVQVGAADGTLDFVDLTRRLQAADYTGYLAIEFTWQDWEGCKNVDNVAESIIIRDALKPLLTSEPGNVLP